MMKRWILVMATLALAACGKTAQLEPPPGKSLPVRPLMATKTPDAEDLLTYTPQARPERVDELVRKSVPRKVDRFDLPPPDGGAAPTLEGEPLSPAEKADPAAPQ